MAIMTLTQPNSAATSQAQTPSRQVQPRLPPPQTFDILPALHELLSRIDHSSSSANGADDSTATSDGDLGTAYSTTDGGAGPLDPKDLPVEVLPLKNKCKRIPREVEQLPDIDRSVEEQREDIAELEEGIRRRKEVLRQVGLAAAGLLAKASRETG